MTDIIAKIQSKMANNPKGLFVLFYTEMWELFGRFGITALLVFYLTNTFHLSDVKAFSIYSGFIALIYVMPIIGGYLSDRLLGLRHAVILGAILMAVGDALLIIPRLDSVYLGLAVIAVGSGFFLPSIVPLVGRLYQADRQGRDAGFTLYYIGKNIGALLAPVLCGLVAKYWAYNYAFILSTLGMISGILVFIFGQRHLVQVEQAEEDEIAQMRQAKRYKNFRGTTITYFSAMVFVPAAAFILQAGIDGYVLAIAGVVVAVMLIQLAIRSDKEVRRHLAAIVMMMVFVIIFSALLGQGGTTLNLFIERIVDRHVFGWQMPPSFYYSLDPVFMILAGPFIAGIWAKMARRQREPSELVKFVIALLLLALGFAVFVIAAHTAMKSGAASSWFVVLGYSLFPVAELCMMPIGLSFVTRLSPPNYDAMMVGVWMLGYSASGYFTGMISDLGHISFKLVTLEAKLHAAQIYLGVFFDSVAILVLSAAVLVLLRPVYHKLIQSRSGVSTADGPADIYY